MNIRASLETELRNRKLKYVKAKQTYEEMVRFLRGPNESEIRIIMDFYMYVDHLLGEVEELEKRLSQ